MKPHLLALGLASAGAVAWAYFTLRGPQPPAVDDVAAVDAPAGLAPIPDRAGPTLADALQRAMEPPREAPPRVRSADRREAEASFDALMLSLEGMADDGERLGRARRDELYRNVNDAFAGLSATLDPNDAEDMQLLEDANIRMKAMLGELDVRAVEPRPTVRRP